MSFTDGMCLGCTARFRREWHLPDPRKPRAPFGLASGLARAAMVVLVVASFAPAERQLGDARPRGTMTAPPETVLVPPAPLEEDTMPALAIADRPRRARRDAPRIALGVTPRPTRSPHASMESIGESSDLVVAASATVPVAESVVPVADSTPVARASVRGSGPVEIASLAVPHAGLTHQAP